MTKIEDSKQELSEERCYRCSDVIKVSYLERYAITKLCDECDEWKDEE